MSGDAQPRKRKNKGRKKGQLEARRSEEYADEKNILRKLSVSEEPPDEEEIFAKFTNPTDEIIHVHKDANLGGNCYTKIVFFCLLAGLGLVIGVTLIQYRGTSDVDAILAKDSQWVALMKDWSDILPFYNGGDEPGNDEHGSEENHNEHEDETHDDNEEKSSSWFDFDFGFSKGDSESESESENEKEVEKSSSWFDLAFGGNEVIEAKDEGSSENDDQDETDEQEQLSEEEQQLSDEQELSEEEQQLSEEQGLSEEEQQLSEEEEQQLSEEVFDRLASFERDDDNDEVEEADQSLENEELENEPESAEIDDETPTEPLIKKKVKQDKNKIMSEEEEELFPEAVEALRREASEMLESTPKEPEETDNEEIEETTNESETDGMAVKFGVGVALVVVAHIVLVKKWNSWAENEITTEMPSESITSEPEYIPLEVRYEPPQYTEKIDPPEDKTSEIQDDYEDDIKLSPKVYEELMAKYGQPTPETSEGELSEDEEQVVEYSDGAESVGEEESIGEEESGNELEESDPEVDDQKWTTLNKPMPETESEPEEEEEETEEETEEESEDEPPPPPPTKQQPRTGGPKSQEQYEFSEITNEEDWAIREELDLADREFNFDKLEPALINYNKLLAMKPNSPRALYGKAKVYDKMAEVKKSNALLEKSIQFYLDTLKLVKIPDVLLKTVAERTINRMRFKGMYLQAVPVHKILIDKFPNEPQFRNDYAISYLMVNRLNEASDLFLNTLRKWPSNAMARAHYGLCLKLQGKMKESISHLKKGLSVDVPENNDARLYFHLGDALSRTGQPEKSLEIYEKGVKKGLFKSKYQRSLYNVDRLTARPWWTQEETTYNNFFKKLESNWEIIRDEGLKALKLKGTFKDEAESLRDVGDWKQFELYARGMKYAENCKKAPVTCAIIDGFEPARTCKRGQSKFSIMEPGTHVWSHCGPTNCRLRTHLGLVVPKGPLIRVADDTRKWKEGEVIVFDDSFEHEVWHNGTSLRLVLIVDVWHPELTKSERLSLTPI